VNVEKNTLEQWKERWKTQRYLPVQILVCSPATYTHYKLNNMSLHENLPTVQRLKPAFDISCRLDIFFLSSSINCFLFLAGSVNADTSVISASNKNCYVVRCENSDTVCTVAQSAIFRSPEVTRVNDVCFVETEEQYRKGQIIFIGKYSYFT
jgi:hypothetical protein